MHQGILMASRGSLFRSVIGLVGATLLLSACSGAPAPTPKAAEVPTTAPAKPAPPVAPAAPAASPAAAAPAASPVSGAPVASPAAAPPAASPAAAARPSGPVDTVTAAVSPNFMHLPTFVAIEKGIFAKNNLDVKTKILSSGQEMAKAVQANEAQFMGGAISNTPTARAIDVDVVGFIGYMNDATTAHSDDMLAILARSDRGIEAGNLNSLVGKKLGTIVGGTGHVYLLKLLKAANIPADKVEVLNVTQANTVSTIQTGAVDAVVAFEPYVAQIRETVPGLITVKQGGGVLGYTIMFSATGDYIKKNPDLVKRMTLALAESEQYIRQHPDEAAEIGTHWVTGLPLGIAKKAVVNMRFDPRISKYTVETYRESVQDLIDQKALKSAACCQPEAAINTTIVDQVLKEHPEFISDIKPIP
ncbi:MAG: ABC transporter substrate-binding protein [Chloroflexi bacterium]|nr:ABC transporter substrate-binding protein [Chloroflexota bacterium]